MSRRPILLMFGIAVPLALATATGVWAATKPPPNQAGNNANAGVAMPAAAAAAPNPNCTLVVPPNPLSAAGLATPYRLMATNRAQGACHENNAAQGAFVQATIVDPATGAVSVYNPLVIDNGKTPAIAPTAPTLPAGAVVGIWFGFQGTTLTLRSNNNSLADGKCVNGSRGSPFGQFAHCNAPAFFAAANAAIQAGMLKVPAIGMGMDGKPCPTVRDFTVIDQDQSDNVTAAYLANRNGATAQDTAANRAKLGANVTTLTNASDNGLVDNKLDPALGCMPFTAPNLADNGTPASSLALNELQAALQPAPVALVPPNDPMAMNGDNMSLAKTNLYRAGVNQPPLNSLNGVGAAYCKNMVNLQPARLQLDRNLTMRAASPDPAAANSLFTFLAQRLSASFTNLNCANLIKVANPVKLKLNNGVAVDATFPGLGGAGMPPAGGGGAPGPQASPSASASASASPAGQPPVGGAPDPNNPQPSASSHW